ncbi:LysR family transcriptional regulator [Bradyrhizobium cajani]|uniref:LysR family transcriptional regulator n=1 Tax=Bradyrhizobium cajani TaxID=1928661 RepID=A0A844TBC0_9BRAD|nr:LysR family transcriptional regulator [Bradyrhizobium cajani]MCP3371823.1 LysR family transcriptional regulator [Bradyrhizobium cajani]MVT76357.1 LysR family transcriptional regulator [Bradyrhizobium cajani]
MDIKGLRYFLAVSDARSFSRAANVALVSQSALSRQISLLEAELGAELFDRHARGVQLTEAGVLLRTRVHALLSQIDHIREEIREEKEEPSGEISLGFPPSLTALMVGRVLRRFQEAYPRVQIRLYEGTTAAVRERIIAADVDVGVISTMERPNDLYCSPLFTEALMLVGPASSDLSPDRPVPATRLADLPQIATTRTNSLRRIVEHALGRSDLVYRPVIEVNTRGLMFALIEDGYGYTVLPSSGVQGRITTHGISAAPIEDVSITWQVATARTRPLTVAARRMTATVREECLAAIRQGDLPTATVDV